MPDLNLPTLEELTGTGHWETGFGFISPWDFQANEQREAQESLGFAPPLPVVLPEVVIQPPPRPVVAPPTTATSVLARLLGGVGLLVTPIRSGPRELDEPQGFRTPAPPDLVVPIAPIGFDPIVNPEVEFETVLPEILIQPPREPPSSRPPIGDDPIRPPNWEDLANEPFDPLSDPIYPRQPFVPLPGGGARPGPATRNPGDPGVSPADDIFPGLWAEPGRTPYGQPGTVAPGVRTEPAADPIGDPFGTPGVDPLPLPTPGPQPGNPTIPGAEPAPGVTLEPFGDPFVVPIAPPRVIPITPPGPAPVGTQPYMPPGLDVFDDPLGFETETQPQPKRADGCECEKPEKKKRQPKPPRAECWQGTYTQRAKGIVYARKRRVPCTNPS